MELEAAFLSVKSVPSVVNSSFELVLPRRVSILWFSLAIRVPLR
jgi:hypothetical protein